LPEEDPEKDRLIAAQVLTYPRKEIMMDRKRAMEMILDAKLKQDKTFNQIAQAVGRHPVWVTSAIMGQQSMSAEEAGKLTAFLGLTGEVATSLQSCPLKGSLDTTVPVDPLIYRFHEITQVYGTTLKALIHETFGDGIMSAIDFEMDIQKKTDPKWDRVVVTMSGKFLPYRKW
jgi:cyanate lyase